MHLADEDGNAILQFLITVGFLLAIVFAGIQLGGSVFTMNAVGTAITRAAYQIDVGGLLLASDKNAYVAKDMTDIDTSLSLSNLSVTNVLVKTDCVRESGPVSSSEGGSLSAITSSTERVAVSFDVSYAIPTIINMTGLDNQKLSRHVEFTRIAERTIEVS